MHGTDLEEVRLFPATWMLHTIAAEATLASFRLSVSTVDGQPYLASEVAPGGLERSMTFRRREARRCRLASSTSGWERFCLCSISRPLGGVVTLRFRHPNQTMWSSDLSSRNQYTGLYFGAEFGRTLSANSHNRHVARLLDGMTSMPPN